MFPYWCPLIPSNEVRKGWFGKSIHVYSPGSEIFGDSPRFGNLRKTIPPVPTGFHMPAVVGAFGVPERPVGSSWASVLEFGRPKTGRDHRIADLPRRFLRLTLFLLFAFSDLSQWLKTNHPTNI